MHKALTSQLCVPNLHSSVSSVIGVDEVLNFSNVFDETHYLGFFPWFDVYNDNSKTLRNNFRLYIWLLGAQETEMAPMNHICTFIYNVGVWFRKTNEKETETQGKSIGQITTNKTMYTLHNSNAVESKCQNDQVMHLLLIILQKYFSVKVLYKGYDSTPLVMMNSLGKTASCWILPFVLFET